MILGLFFVLFTLSYLGYSSILYISIAEPLLPLPFLLLKLPIFLIQT